MEDAVDSIVLGKRRAHKVSRNIKDDQPLQVLQFDGLLDVADQVVAQVQFHQVLQLIKAVQARNFVVF